MRTSRPLANRIRIPGRECGAALIVALLFLVILAMLGVSSMTGTTLEERMSGNARDQNIAMQAAEAALRDAEKDLVANPPQGRVTVAKFVALCTAALCTEGAPVANLDDVLKSAFYGQFTGELAMSIPRQPRYMVELLNAVPAQIPTPPLGLTWRNFRVTAKGYGLNPNTIVILQTVYAVAL